MTPSIQKSTSTSSCDDHLKSRVTNNNQTRPAVIKNLKNYALPLFLEQPAAWRVE